jgi:hypothetical protein
MVYGLNIWAIEKEVSKIPPLVYGQHTDCNTGQQKVTQEHHTPSVGCVRKRVPFSQSEEMSF